MNMKFLITPVLLTCLVFGGCKDESNPAGTAQTNSTMYTGIVAGGGISGSLTITIPLAKTPSSGVLTAVDTVAITGILRISGDGTVSLTGIYIDTTGEFSMSGGGYVFTGFADEENITGSFTGPGGSGIFVAEAGAPGTVRSYCGTYQDEPPGTETGVFNMVINGTSIIVIISPSGTDQSFATYGVLSGSEIAIYDSELPEIPIATGTVSTDGMSVSGSYIGESNGGTWSGTLCN